MIVSVAKVSWKEIVVAILIIIIPNAIMYGVAFWVDVERPAINFDYVVVALFLAVSPRWVTLPVFAICLFLDALGVVRQIVPVVNVLDSFYLLGFIGVAPFQYQLAFVFSLVASLALIVLLGWWGTKTSKGALAIVVNVMLLVYVFKIIFLGSAGATYREIDDNFIASQAVSAYEASTGGFVSNFSVAGNDPFEEKRVKSATASWFDAPGKVGEKVLLIVSESWGLADYRVQESLLSPLRKSEQVKGFSQGELVTAGVTVQGELRELCRLRPRYLNLENVSEGFEQCLPAIFQRLGFRTMAIHGAAGAMYDRRKWYPRMGFDKTVFFENKQWEKRCYSFPGACDEELINEITNFFRGEGPAFVYWLTLNSHVPYDKRDLSVDVFDCEAVGVKASSRACFNFKLHAQFFYYLEKALHKDSMRGVRVLVVGDHEPPMLEEEDREYFERSKVPWIGFYGEMGGN